MSELFRTAAKQAIPPNDKARRPLTAAEGSPGNFRQVIATARDAATAADAAGNAGMRPPLLRERTPSSAVATRSRLRKRLLNGNGPDLSEARSAAGSPTLVAVGKPKSRGERCTCNTPYPLSRVRIAARACFPRSSIRRPLTCDHYTEVHLS